MRNKFFILFLLPFLFFSCDPDRFGGAPSEVEGYVPVYATNISTAKQIISEPARAIVNGGKIYTVGSLLFQVEQDSGIHIINYADANNPQKLGFIKSFLCKEVTVKNGFIYTNNLSDLVVIDISNPNNVHEVSRVTGVFPDLALQYPSKTNSTGTIYFECPDPSKGLVVGWKKQIIKNPKCWR
jgi:LVIVD repeat